MDRREVLGNRVRVEMSNANMYNFYSPERELCSWETECVQVGARLRPYLSVGTTAMEIVDMGAAQIGAVAALLDATGGRSFLLFFLNCVVFCFEAFSAGRHLLDVAMILAVALVDVEDVRLVIGLRYG
jgi:hypothetical protein